MSTETISHCDTPIFSSFLHCPDCGDKLDNKPKISTVEQIQSTILDPIKPFYKDASLFTGIILTTHLYTRSKTVTSGNSQSKITETFEVPFNFVSIETETGEVIKINLDGNDKAVNEITVGDAITIFEPTAFYITMDAPRNLSHQLNNRLADTFIVHKQDGSRYSRKNTSELFTPTDTSFFDALGHAIAIFLGGLIIAYMFIWFGPSVPQIIDAMFVDYSEKMMNFALSLTAEDTRNMAWLSSIVVGVGAGYRYFLNGKKHAAKVIAYNKVIKSLRNITFKALGYHQRSIKKSNTDVFCSACDTRLPQENKHCSACGTAQQSESLIKRDSQSSEDSEDSIEVSIQAPTPLEIPNISIRDKRLALMKEYQFETPEELFEYHILLGKTEQITCSANARIYRVLDRSVYTEELSSGSTYTTSTDTYNRSGTLVRSSNSSHTTINRRIDIQGKVLVEDHEGNIDEIEVHPEILSSLDAGNYLFVASQTIQHEKEKAKSYRMIAHNITKNFYIKPYDIRDYENSSIRETLTFWCYTPLSIFIGYMLPMLPNTLVVLINNSSIKDMLWINDSGIRENIFQILHIIETLKPVIESTPVHWGVGILTWCILAYRHSSRGKKIDKSNHARAWEIVKPVFDKWQTVDTDLAEKLSKYT